MLVVCPHMSIIIMLYILLAANNLLMAQFIACQRINYLFFWAYIKKHLANRVVNT